MPRQKPHANTGSENTSFGRVVVVMDEASRLTTGLYGGAASVYGEFCAVNETGTIRCQEDDGFGNLVGGSRTASRRLGGELLQSLTHRVRTFRARRSRADCIDADPTRTILSRPCFRQQIDGGLAGAIETHTRHPVIRDHCRYIDDCPFSSLRHQRGKFSDEEVWRLNVERVHVLKRFFRRVMG